MHQAIIFGSMLATGVALFGSAAWIQVDRSAFTDSAPAEATPLRTTVSALKVEEPTPVKEETELVFMELPPIEITGRRHVSAAITPKMSDPAVEPCSEWQDIGPERVNDGNGIGIRRVRTLCPRPLGIAISPR